MLESIGAASVDVAATLAEIKNLRVEVQPIPDPIHAVVEDTRFTYTGKELEKFVLHVSQTCKVGAVMRRAGKPFAVYIRQPHMNNEPRVHLTWCKKLEDMKAAGLYDRYVATDTTESDSTGVGLFAMDRGYSTKERLAVCLLCRKNIERGFGVRSSAMEKKYLVRLSEDRHGLNVAGWFSDVGLTLVESAITLLPNKSADLLDHRNYTDDWRDVSWKMREGKGWRCSQCSVNLSAWRALLQVHHVNHIRSDNRAENLKVLCLQCHSNQPAHEHMKNAPDYRENVMLIESVRRSRK
jgi:hypothetical protein